MITYFDYSVYTAAKNRISYIFDEFEKIVVSVSSGKDSCVLYYLVLEEAKKRNRKIHVFFLDQEIEYLSSIEFMRELMSHELVIPMWYQVPLYMTNATSYTSSFLYAWGIGEQWIREKESISIQEIEEKYPDRFYSFFPWLESKQKSKTAFLIGVRSKESLHRFRAVTKSFGYKDIKWSTKTKNNIVYRFYPVYDWTFGDIWKYIDDNNLSYNKIYDKMYIKNGVNIRTTRVSNLIHEKSYKCLSDLQEYEPDTYNKVIERVSGSFVAARYANEDYIYDANKLPDGFDCWKTYRDYLLSTSGFEHKDRFLIRFEKQDKNEYVYKQQVKQLLLNDWENSIGVKKKKRQKRTLAEWKEIL